MKLFSNGDVTDLANVDDWGAAEWFDRLARAIRAQDRAVVAGDMAEFEIYRSIAASSAMRFVRDYEAEVRAALDSPPDHSEGEGWQSIETAPKDGTPILVGRGRVNLGDGTYKDGIVLEAQWDANELGWYFGGYVGGWLKVDPEHPPTHWQPLPEPPHASLPTRHDEQAK
jgi:hypothetical protein